MERVVHVLWRGGVGGKSRAVYQLALHQQASGRDVSLAFGQGEGYFYELARASGLPVVSLDLRNARDLRGAVRARRVLQRYAVHHFHVAEPGLMLASMMCRDVRRVYTHRAGVHDYGSRRALRYRAARYLLGSGWTVTGTAQAAIAAEQLFGRPRKKVVPTFNAIDLDLLIPKAAPARLRLTHGADPHNVIVGTAADLRDWKRIEWLIEAAGSLQARDWLVWILGDGEDRARLEGLAAESPAAGRIRFLGMKAEIADWLHALDVFVLPSGPEESFGNAVVEAMACGLPVIVAKDCPAHLAHIRTGGTGFAASDPDDLAAHLERLIGDVALRQETGRRARDYVRDEYSVPRMLERFDAAYAATGP